MIDEITIVVTGVFKYRARISEYMLQLMEAIKSDIIVELVYLRHIR